MQTEAERIFYRRIYILIALTAAILCGLFYLMLLTRGHVPSMKPSVQPSFTAVNKLTRSIEVEKTEILVTAEAKPEPVPVEPKPEPVPADPERPFCISFSFGRIPLSCPPVLRKAPLFLSRPSPSSGPWRSSPGWERCTCVSCRSSSIRRRS